jgi:hypothetical protein
MPALTLTKNYADTTILYASDFDVWLSELETLLNVTKLDGDNIQDAGITASSYLADSTVVTANLAASSVTSAKVADDTIVSSNVAAANITTAKLAANAVTTAKLNTSAVTTAKITDSTITRNKFAASTNSSIVQSPVTGTVSATTTATTILGLSCTITTTGKPVEIRVFPSGQSDVLFPGALQYSHDSTNSIYAIIEIIRDSTTVFSASMDRTLGSLETASVTRWSTIGPVIDVPIAGTYTYYLKFRNSSATGLGSKNTLISRDMTLFVREL